MFARDQYELIDFGQGRKLERFGQFVLDRPSIVAGDFARELPDAWNNADARYHRTSGDLGEWRVFTHLPECWAIRHETFALEIKRTPFGHVGVFPEQAENWDWIADRIRALAAAEQSRRPRVLNLFAYTGGSTLAAAAAGAEVVHVDAAANTVAWARRNAELSGLAEAPIRWIVEDAKKFVDREIRRGNRYDMIVADPPAYGHGPKGRTWGLVRDLGAFGAAAVTLLEASRGLILFTHHSETLTADQVRGFLRGSSSSEAESQPSHAGGKAASETLGDLILRDRSGRALHGGYFTRLVT
jgi:23S rRNA (cytosine1962-C5)-methyltransferase